MTEVQRVAKRGRNDFHKYDYATEADVLEAVRGGLAARNIVVIPRVVGEQVTEVQRQGKDARFITRVDMVFTIVDGDSDAVMECPWKGWGEDSGDKGGYKAITGADKYFFLKLFLIPTGDDPEREGKRKAKRQDERPEPPADQPKPEGDAAAILEAAAELAQHYGNVDAGSVITEASKFTKDGATCWFSDPREKGYAQRDGSASPQRTNVPGAGWRRTTLDRLNRDLHKLRAKAEPGAAEAAELFQ